MLSVTSEIAVFPNYFKKQMQKTIAHIESKISNCLPSLGATTINAGNRPLRIRAGHEISDHTFDFAQ
ncbi:MAG: hypothetical protein JW915_18635 [Chitinispirillaceae bacterium]|nr:hypothetical protein [Chitinispirillaceae bacterium]